MKPIQRRTQVSVFIDNRPGTMSRLTQALGRRKVNVEAVAAWGERDLGVVRLIVDSPLEAVHMIGQHGLPCTETTVLRVQLPNMPGALNQITSLLARRKVNLDYCYGATSNASGVLFVKADDLRRAERALQSSPLFRTPAPRARRTPAPRGRARRRAR